MTEADGSIRVCVRDEGKGFDLGQETDGFGLLGMRERVELAGGTMEVTSTPGEGASITAVLPAQHRQESPGEAATVAGDEATGRAAEGS